MKFSILQQDLLPSLQAVLRSSGVRNQLPVLGNILLQAEQGRLKLAATNLEIGSIKYLKAQIEEDGEITVPGRTLTDLVANLSGEMISIWADADHLEISTPTFSSKLTGIPAAEFPVIPLAGQKAITIDSDFLAKALPQVAFSSAVDEGRPVLTGILTQIKDKKLELVATDGYRLAHKVVELDKAAEFKSLVPRKTFEEIIRLLAEDPTPDLEVSISDDQNQIIFKFANTEVSSRLIEGQFPAWERIIPAEIKAKIVADRAEVLRAVKLASVFAKGEANIVKLQTQANKLILTSETKELGNQRKELEVKADGEEIQIAFNTKFLQEALSACNCKDIALEFSGNLSAAILRPVQEAGLEYIIMPVNLN